MTRFDKVEMSSREKRWQTSAAEEELHTQNWRERRQREAVMRSTQAQNTRVPGQGETPVSRKVPGKTACLMQWINFRKDQCQEYYREVVVFRTEQRTKYQQVNKRSSQLE